MASSPELIEFLTLKFKPILLPSPSSPPASFSSVAAAILSIPGVLSLHLGQRIESPGLWTAVVRWESPAAYDAFVSSSASTERAAAVRALVDDPHPHGTSVLLAGDVAAVLDAPTLEVCTAWGVDEGFLSERVGPFARAVDAARLNGYHGQAHGEFEQAIQEGVDVPTEKAVKLLLGWESRDAHLQHKDSGSAIDENIHLLRSGRKGFEMYHVSLKKL